MSAAEQRKLLEQLMGKEALGGIPDDVTYTDPKVCRNFLCGLCPHDLFTNTKMDIGPCSKIHSEKLLKDYENARAKEEHPGFEEEWFHSLSEFVADCDRKIANAQRRLDKIPEDSRVTQLMREVGDLTNEIATLTSSIEELGEKGEVSESMKVLASVEGLQKTKAEKEREIQRLTGNDGNNQQQKLRVCDRCSAYLSIYDSDRRLADHFGGKMHIGFVQIREKVDELRGKGFGQTRSFGARKPDERELGWSGNRHDDRYVFSIAVCQGRRRAGSMYMLQDCRVIWRLDHVNLTANAEAGMGVVETDQADTVMEDSVTADIVVAVVDTVMTAVGRVRRIIGTGGAVVEAAEGINVANCLLLFTRSDDERKRLLFASVGFFLV
ncbi:splicing factor [Borealophlyctis nickersoniae]|nr:splicing factor [Borealophlyctis nickersoniae]